MTNCGTDKLGAAVGPGFFRRLRAACDAKEPAGTPGCPIGWRGWEWPNSAEPLSPLLFNTRTTKTPLDELEPLHQPEKCVRPYTARFVRFSPYPTRLDLPGPLHPGPPVL